MTADSIPIIDIAPLSGADANACARTTEALHDAASNVGFFYIANHGVPEPLLTETFSLAREFFGSSVQQKREVSVSAHHRGWLEIGEAKMYGNLQTDLKESFIWGLDIASDDADYRAGGRLLAPNLWPSFLPKMRDRLMEYFFATQRCGETLLRAFANGLGIAPDYFVRHFDKPISRAALIHYPPQPDVRRQPGSGVHTDYGMLTVLCQDDVGGLQVRTRDGSWLDVEPVEGTYVVNIGDLLARWSNGHFESTPHRVVSSTTRDRYSLATFIDPNWDAMLDPATAPNEVAHFEPVRCADYIAARFDEAFAYREMQGVRDSGER